MNTTQSTQPSLCIDLKKNRIRIHKKTLHMLGNPEYIQLLVNPVTKTIALRRTVRSDYLAHKVNPEQFTDGNCCELYSQEFIRTLFQVNSDWEKNQTYRIYGCLVGNNSAAHFRMEDVTPISGE